METKVFLEQSLMTEYEEAISSGSPEVLGRLEYKMRLRVAKLTREILDKMDERKELYLLREQLENTRLEIIRRNIKIKQCPPNKSGKKKGKNRIDRLIASLGEEDKRELLRRIQENQKGGK